ncbi:MAG: hypothetical protein QY325_04295 [Flavobacteriales bacterium]|nr:MAG: hypothetical protein QY325_04295 [Flavobacteriales bacterium]
MSTPGIICLALAAVYAAVSLVHVTDGELDIRWAWASAWVLVGVQVMHIRAQPPSDGFPDGIDGHTDVEIGCGLFAVWCSWTHRPKPPKP